ncbi:MULTISPECIES: hypothetical protein [unclassified Anabaena]|nr:MULTISPECIES: hypothetical protein [unclassified Anabaena]
MSTNLTVYSFRESRFNRTRNGGVFHLLVSKGGVSPPITPKTTNNN